MLQNMFKGTVTHGKGGVVFLTDEDRRQKQKPARLAGFFVLGNRAPD